MSDLTLAQLQVEHLPWANHNFPDRKPHMPLLGAIEELGELCHVHLKYEQRIREYASDAGHYLYRCKAEDAIGDVLVFLADYCNQNGLDFQRALEATWTAVRERDWQADPVSAHVGHGA